MTFLSIIFYIFLLFNVTKGDFKELREKLSRKSFLNEKLSFISGVGAIGWVRKTDKMDSKDC